MARSQGPRLRNGKTSHDHVGRIPHSLQRIQARIPPAGRETTMTLARNTKVDMLPQMVLDAFEGRATLTVPELCRAMEMDAKTLRKHIAAETLPVHVKGTGVARRHYVCTLPDVAAFYEATA